MGALSLFHPYKPDFRPPQGALTPQRSVRIDPMRHIAARHVFALVVALIVGVTVFYRLPEPLPELTRAEFMAEVRAGQGQAPCVGNPAAPRKIAAAATTLPQKARASAPGRNGGKRRWPGGR